MHACENGGWSWPSTGTSTSRAAAATAASGDALRLARASYRTPLGDRMRAAERLTGAERIEAYAAVDRDLAAQAAPLAEAMSSERTDFFSARIGCQVEHPLYGIDLGALCVRN